MLHHICIQINHIQQRCDVHRWISSADFYYQTSHFGCPLIRNIDVNKVTSFSADTLRASRTLQLGAVKHGFAFRVSSKN